MQIFTDDYLLNILDEEDRRLFIEGKQPSARQFQAIVSTCRRIGHTFTIGMVEDQLTKRIQELSRRFFRPKDSGAPSLFTGLMVHLGLSFQINVPIIFGNPQINPFEHTDATNSQLRRLNRNAAELAACLTQICDVWDIGTQLSGMAEKLVLDGRAGEYFNLSAFHLMAAVVTVSQSFASRGAIQSSLISAELAIKCAHMRSGKTEDWLKSNVGHSLRNQLSELSGAFGIDFEAVDSALTRLPPMVAERYGNHNVPIVEVKDCVLAAQGVLAAVARSIAGYGFRDRFKAQ